MPVLDSLKIVLLYRHVNLERDRNKPIKIIEIIIENMKKTN